MKLLTDLQLFPSIEYIKMLEKYKYLFLYSYERFRKRSFSNRYVIVGANGLINLTIPIEGGREQKTLLKEVLIDYSTYWPTRHWRSIKSSYSKAPFFDNYAQEISSILFKKEKYLWDLNIFSLNTIAEILSINVLIEEVSDFNSLTLNDLRYSFTPGNFQGSLSRPLHYSQVFEDRLGFQTNLSIIDLLFCQGPNSLHLLKQGKS